MPKYEVVEFVEVDEGWNFQGSSHSKPLDPPEVFDSQDDAIKRAEELSRTTPPYHYYARIKGEVSSN